MKKVKYEVSLTRLPEELPTDAKSLLKIWKELKSDMEEIDILVSTHKEILKEITDEIGNHLSIDEGHEKSETISVPDIATTWKTRNIGVKVNDFERFQKFCSDFGCSFVMRKQVNLSGAKELHEMIMSGDIPDTDSIEFYTFDKVTIRKK